MRGHSFSAFLFGKAHIFGCTLRRTAGPLPFFPRAALEELSTESSVSELEALALGAFQPGEAENRRFRPDLPPTTHWRDGASQVMSHCLWVRAASLVHFRERCPSLWRAARNLCGKFLRHVTPVAPCHSPKGSPNAMLTFAYASMLGIQASKIQFAQRHEPRSCFLFFILGALSATSCF